MANLIWKRSKRDRFAELQSQVNVQVNEGEVRVKIDLEGYKIFSKASKIEIDGEVFRITSDASKVGPFTVKFYTLYLRRV